MGLFAARPVGFILHGSRSGIATRSRQQEYDGTRTYAENSLVRLPDGTTYYTGWNATIGERQYSVHFDCRRWGWNAGRDGETRMATEIAHAVRAWNVTNDQIAAWAAWYWRQVVPVWGHYDLDDPRVLKAHGELPQGQSIGKDDVHAATDPRLEDVKQRLRRAV